MHRFIVLGLVLALLVSSALLMTQSNTQAEAPAPDTQTDAAPSAEKEKKLQLAFSEKEHFYKDSIDVAITASVKDAKIYYTTDGSEPTSTNGKEYSEPLRFDVPPLMKTVILKASAVKGDTVSSTVTHTYFIGKNVDERFNTLIFSLSTDNKNLYDYETGILTAGKARDDYLAENPGLFWVNPPAPANYNWRGMEGERPVYVEVFTSGGKRVVSQAAGLRVSGGWSRANDQKSLRLIARNEYEQGAGKFRYNFFPEDYVSGGYGSAIAEYNSLVLRDGANDRDNAMLRNETSSALAADAGFREVSPSKAAVVFLNGVYYGFAWLQVSLDEQYLQDIYGAPTDDFDIVGDGEQSYNSDNAPAVSDLKELSEYSEKDLTDDAVFAEFEAKVDVDNLLFYYAYEIYMGNDDWPHNNMKRWRYTGPQTGNLAPELDGRWRFLLYDLDWTLGLYGEKYTVPTFNNVLVGTKRTSPMLISVLRRADMAEKFSMMLCDIASSVASAQKVEAKIGLLFEESKKEISTALSSYKYSAWTSLQSVLENHSDMITFAEKRGDFILNSVRDYFEYEDSMFEVRVTGGEAVLGTQKGTSSRYFSFMTVPVSPSLQKFEVFDHWVVNGETVSEPDITVSSADAVNGTVSIELVTRHEQPPLIISDTYASPQRNGCVLVNTTDETVKTGGLFMSDSIDNPFRWELPAASVAPGSSLAFAGKGSSDINDLLKIQMGFNVKSGEILLLSDETGKILDYVRID